MSPRKGAPKKSKRLSGSTELNKRIFTASMFVNSKDRPQFKRWVAAHRSMLHPSMPPSKIISLYKKSLQTKSRYAYRTRTKVTPKRSGSRKGHRSIRSPRRMRGGFQDPEGPQGPEGGLTDLERALVLGTGTGLLTNNRNLGLGVGLGSFALSKLAQGGQNGCGCGK